VSVVCKLVRDSTDVVDFQDGSSSFQLAEDGWLPRVARLRNGRAAPVIETLRVRVSGSSHDNLATQLQNLAEAQWWADQYMSDPGVEDPVWFHAKLNSEAGERRALVRSIEWAWETSYYDAEAINDEARLVITIERGPYWEATTSTSLSAVFPAAMGFNSGSTEFTIGETLTGNSSGDTATVAFWIVTSGTWGGGDAAGTVYLSDRSTTGATIDDFTDGEGINGSVGGNNMATVNGNASSHFVSVIDYASSDIVGDVPARVNHLYAGLESAGGRAWFVIRSDDKTVDGDAGELIPIWEWEDGSQEDTDATGQTDGSNTASPYSGDGNDHIQVTEGTSGTDWDDGDYHKIYSITLNDLEGTNYDAFFGIMKWLLRGKVDASTAWDLQLRFGYETMSDAGFINGPTETLDETSWNLIEMGIQRIPMRDYQSLVLAERGAGYEKGVEIQLWGSRTSGTGDLYLDCLVMLPVDEGYLFCEFDNNAATDDELVFAEGPSGGANAILTNSSGTWEQFFPYDDYNMRLPVGDGRLIVVLANLASSSLTAGISFAVEWYPRWLSLRGDE